MDAFYPGSGRSATIKRGMPADRHTHRFRVNAIDHKKRRVPIEAAG
jgi:hypothetical protein